MTTVARPARAVRLLIGVLFACGFLLLTLSVVFAFEEPHGTMLVVSAGLLVAGACAVLLHLYYTRLLTPAQKRMWLRLLVGRRAPRAWSEYLTSSDLAAAAAWLSSDEGRSR